MKRSISNIITSMFLILTLALFLPFASANAMTSSSGDGTEGNPHKLSIGYCTNDAFIYTPHGGECYLDVTFAANAEVSVSFPQSSPIVTLKRAGVSSYRSLSDGTFYVKQGETVSILITRAQSSVPIQFTSKALSDVSLYCSKSTNGKHSFTASHGAQCANGCGRTCNHPKASREYYNDYSCLSSTTHAQYFECKTCGVKTYDASDAKACTYSKWIASNNYNNHSAECTVCGHVYTENCSFNTIKYKKTSWDMHAVNYTCPKCGKIGKTKSQAHSFKSNKCTKCKFVRVVPGKTAITTAKQSGKGIKKVKKYKGTYTWNRYYNRWDYIKPRTEITYSYKIQLKYKKAKNATKYVVSTSKSINATRLSTTSKTSVSFTYKSSKKRSSVTLYVIPISKTGTPGTPIKKVVKLRN